MRLFCFLNERLQTIVVIVVVQIRALKYVCTCFVVCSLFSALNRAPLGTPKPEKCFPNHFAYHDHHFGHTLA